MIGHNMITQTMDNMVIMNIINGRITNINDKLMRKYNKFQEFFLFHSQSWPAMRFAEITKEGSM